ncbi:MAG TPA: DUF2321 domain-containing protein [Gemmatimonadales bacterium]|nr:DUF2321 domain-containing protein [Gemmatimonadales bacterium]
MGLERWRPRADGYCVAQICLNGHVIAHQALRADDLQPFCSQCGKETLVKCALCGETIRGTLPDGEQNGRAAPYVRPSFCPACGGAYPWTTAQLDAARDLAKGLEGLSAREHELLAASLDELIADTPRASLAATQFNSLVAKARGAGVRALRNLVVEIAAEAAKQHVSTGV